jgi:hypothetical protein
MIRRLGYVLPVWIALVVVCFSWAAVVGRAGIDDDTYWTGIILIGAAAIKAAIRPMADDIA